MKIGIVGSRIYENKRKIKETIYRLRQKFTGNLTIVSGGCPDGADRYAKKYALEMECSYKEFNPSHTNPNLYSACNENFYNKPYSPKNFFHRNKLLAKYCDCIIGFIAEGDRANGTNHTLIEAKKMGKKITIIN